MLNNQIIRYRDWETRWYSKSARRFHPVNVDDPVAIVVHAVYHFNSARINERITVVAILVIIGSAGRRRIQAGRN